MNLHRQRRVGNAVGWLIVMGFVVLFNQYPGAYYVFNGIVRGDDPVLLAVADNDQEAVKDLSSWNHDFNVSEDLGRCFKGSEEYRCQTIITPLSSSTLKLSSL